MPTPNALMFSAGGTAQFFAGGGAHFGASGDGCNCATFYQARLCSTGALSGFWLPPASIPSFPYKVKRNADGLCYVFFAADHGAGGAGFGALTTGVCDTACNCVVPCPYSGDHTFPSCFTVTFTGVTICTGVCYTGGGAGHWRVNSGNINGTFLFPLSLYHPAGFGGGGGGAFANYQPSPFPSLISATAFTDACITSDGDPIDPFVFQLAVQQSPINGSFSLRLQSAFYFHTYGTPFPIFDKTVGATCFTFGTSLTFANTIITCGEVANPVGSFDNHAGSGGSAVVTPCC